jgi:hypothetical protein
MKNKFAMVTRADDNITDLTKVTHPILMDYAKQWGCDFIVLDEKEEWMTDYELAHYRILRVGEILEHYERVLVVDSDVVIQPTCPNPFDVVPYAKIGTIYEDKGSREAARQGVIISIQERWGDVGWEEGYINTGFFVVSREHKDIFQRINDQLWTGFGYDDALLGYNIHKFGHEVHELPFTFNHMAMFSEDWNGNANRFESFVIHYAGLALFPDDRSGRKVTGDNNMKTRLELIESDILRITNGLMGFANVKSLKTQGHGSRTYSATIGAAEKEVILKVSNTEECMEREVKVLMSDIPGIVKMWDVGMSDIGKFMVLERLYDIPDDLPVEVMLTIATDVLITLRQLHKNGIPWICRKEHIKMDIDGHVKLIDFGDDEYRQLPFYGSEEAIIMDGDCDSDGVYLGKDKTPLSGYVAIMKWMCQKNGYPVQNILDAAEASLIAYEYQNLKDVHQPIWFVEYNDIPRTESEKDDPKFGQLVHPNRGCKDRAEMIYENIEPWMTGDTSWLDMGCNVGWFVFEFSEHFNMFGVDFDIEKIAFAKMLTEGQETPTMFAHMDVNVKTVQAMPSYDVISIMSMLHLKLVEDRNKHEFWQLFRAISEKARKCLFLEFPPHSYKWLELADGKAFMDAVKLVGEFDSVEEIGNTDAGRPMIKCLK